jgi:hypothetical protein
MNAADSIPDLVVIRRIDAGSVEVEVLLGHGDGTFSSAALQDLAGQFSTSLTVGDVDGNGSEDVVVLGDQNVAAMLGDGDGGLAPAVTTTLTMPPNTPGYGTPRVVSDSGLAAADFDLDGSDEVVFGFTTEPGLNERGPLAMLNGNADGTFQQRTLDAIGTGATDFSVGLINGDARPDILGTNSYSDVRGNAAEYLATSADDFERVGLEVGSANAVLDDFDHSGTADVATVGYDYGEGGFLAGAGDGTFAPKAVEHRWPDSSRSHPTGLVRGDFDGDGWTDVARSEGDGSVLVQRNVLGGDGGVKLRIKRLRVPGNTGALASEGALVIGACSVPCKATAKLELIGGPDRGPLSREPLLRGGAGWGPAASELFLRPSSRPVRRALRHYDGPALRARVRVVGRSPSYRAMDAAARVKRPIRAPERR